MSAAAPPLPPSVAPPARRGSAAEAPGRLLLTEPEYWRFQATAERPHEWVCGIGMSDAAGEELGEVRPKDGYDDDGNPAMPAFEHNELVDTLSDLLKEALRGTGHGKLSQGMAVRGGRLRYPDLLIYRRPGRFEPHPKGERLVLENPSALIEVLSDSTEATDRGDKLEEYAAIPTVTDYLLVAQDEMRVQHFRRPAGASVADGWRVTPHAGPDAAVTLAAPALTLPLADIYARLFPAA